MVKKLLMFGGGGLVVIVLGLATFVMTFKPALRPAPDVKIQSTPEMVARGDYLVNHALQCMECHAERDFSRYGAPKVTLGANGFCWKPEMHFPGHLCAANLTSDPETGLGNWTDGEILRAMREGVSRDGHALMLMPYEYYAHLGDEDAHAVVAYLRTLPPVKWQQPKTAIDFPVSFFMKLGPKPLDGPVTAPTPADGVRYGEYRATVGLCKECHTPVDDKHKSIPGMEFAGGQTFRGPFGIVRSANLTPDETGIKAITRETFLGMFAAFADPAAARPIAPDQNTIMPWIALSGMKPEDLGAIYDFLRTVKPISNKVEKKPAGEG